MAQSITQEIIVALVVLLPVLLQLIYIQFQGDYKPPVTHILDGTIAGHRRMVISQDPNNSMAKTIYPSDGKRGQKDLAFTYSWWMAVSDYEGRAENPFADRDADMSGRTYVWQKGSPGGFPLRCPGVFFKRENGQPNTMEIQLNTFAAPVETLSIGNLPVDKWFQCVLTVEGRSAKVYINGRLKAAKELNGIVRLNYGNVYIGENKGFAGYISNLVQKNQVVSYSEMATDIRAGPSTKVIGDVIAKSGNIPPYFHNRWWLNQ